MPELKIPNTIQDVTADWLTEALRSTGTLERSAVVSFEVEPLAVGQGFTSQIARLTLQLDIREDDSQPAVIIKLQSHNPDVKGFMNQFGFYEREVKFYQQITPNIDLRTPRNYYSSSDLDTGNHVLLLEDLAPVAQIGDNVQGCSIEDTKLVIRELAKLHAKWWNSPELPDFDWLPSYSGDPERAQQRHQRFWEQFKSRFEGSIPTSFEAACMKVEMRVSEIRHLLAGPPQAITHGDCRLDNLFFGNETSDFRLAIFDWQVPIKGLGVSDVAYFLGFCVDPEIRRPAEVELLKTYHSALVEHGITDYDFEDCARHYSLSVFTVLSRVVVSGAVLDFSSKRGRALMVRVMRRANAMLEDHDILEMLD